MANNNFDVIVIGGGPGGYVCAIRCAQLGLNTALVERENLGGICLNWGCIPTKALLRSSEIWHLVHRLNEFGFAAADLKFDLPKIVERSRKVAAQLSNGVRTLMRKNKIAVITRMFGTAKSRNAFRYATAETSPTRSTHGIRVASSIPGTANAIAVTAAANAPLNRDTTYGARPIGVVKTISSIVNSVSRSTAFDAKIATANAANNDSNASDSVMRYGDVINTLPGPNGVAAIAKPRRKKSAAAAKNDAWRV